MENAVFAALLNRSLKMTRSFQKVILFAITLTILSYNVLGFAEWMTKDFCDRSLGDAVRSDSSYSLTF